MAGSIRLNLFAAASFLERYVLSFVYFYLGYVEWTWLNRGIRAWPPGAGIFSPDFAHATQHFIVAIMQLLVGALLLNSRPAAVEPRRLREIFVPLAACFFFITYGFIYKLPVYWRASPFSNRLLGPLAVIGLTLGVIGPFISLRAAYTLGKSYGIFVTVREVVLSGPYRCVRHPIYLGYFFIQTGFLLANMSRAIFCLVPIHMLLFVYRARLEEARLAEASPAYREAMQRTGFILPRHIEDRLFAPAFGGASKKT